MTGGSRVPALLDTESFQLKVKVCPLFALKCAWHRMCVLPVLTMFPISTSEALRYVGQDLDLRGLKTFSIQCDDDLYVVEGGYQPPPAAMPVTIHYCGNDIRELNRKAHESSDYLSATRSFLYLSGILSAIGTYVEDKAGRLVSISNKESSRAVCVIDIEYEMAGGDRIFERLGDEDVYTLSIRDHIRGKRKNAPNPRFSRFSSMTEPVRPRHNKIVA